MSIIDVARPISEQELGFTFADVSNFMWINLLATFLEGKNVGYGIHSH